MTKCCLTFEFGAVQIYINLVDLVKNFPTRIYLQKSASIQPRTSPSKFGGKFNSLFTSLLSRQGRQGRRRDATDGPAARQDRWANFRRSDLELTTPEYPAVTSDKFHAQLSKGTSGVKLRSCSFCGSMTESVESSCFCNLQDAISTLCILGGWGVHNFLYANCILEGKR